MISLRFLPLTLALATPAAAQDWFETALYLPDVDAAGWFAGIGDVDLVDGPDLLFIEGLKATTYIAFRIYFNDGKGAFAPGPLHALPPDENHVPLERGLADVTGDGLVDVLIGVYPDSFGIYPGLPGGGFGAFVGAPLEHRIVDAAVGDSNGDGVADLAVMNRLGAASDADLRVRWWRWNGAGFDASAAIDFVGKYPAPSASCLAALDFTGDGVDDLAAGADYDSLIRMMATVGGSPTSDVALDVAFDAAVHGVALAAGDIDGDGDGDLLASGYVHDAFPYPDKNAFQVVRFQAGVATLGPVSSSLAYPVDPLLADWDGDGDADIVDHGDEEAASGHKTRVQLVENLTGDSFATTVHYVRTNQHWPLSGVADLNQDGHPDLGLWTGAVFGTGRFEHVPKIVAGSILFELLPSSHYDWQDDGDLDAYLRSGEIQPNDGTGDFSDPGAVIPVYPPAPPFTFYDDAAAIADFTGDGRADFLTPLLFEEMRLYADDGRGGFVDLGAAAPHLQYIVSPVGQVPHADLDLDGDLDLLTTGSFWANDGTGFFPGSTSPFIGVPLDIGDVEADGDLDILTRKDIGASEVILQRSTGGLSYISEPLLSVPNTSYYSVLRDLEGDGDLDALIGSLFGPEVYALENAGGSFAATTLVGLEENAVFVDVFDADRDGLEDIVAVGDAQAYESDELAFVTVFRRTDPDRAVYAAPAFYAAAETTGFADVDGDADVDAVGGFVVPCGSAQVPEAGVIRQYGTGTPGTGGVVPVLGAKGPVEPGSPSAELRVRQAVGGGLAFVFVGTQPAAIPDYPFPGATVYFEPVVFHFPLLMSGPAGAAGEGKGSFPLQLVASLFPGATFYHQAAVFDAGAPFGAALTNGLQITYGL